jgi:transcriptional regulator with XRE-family HTH domain
MESTPVEDGSLILTALGAAIRDHRLQAGLTQAELAQRAGIGDARAMTPRRAIRPAMIPAIEYGIVPTCAVSADLSCGACVGLIGSG